MPSSPRFDDAVLTADPVRRALLVDVLGAGLDAVDPVQAVARALAGVDTGGCTRVVVVGLGKAGLGMAEGAATALAGMPMAGVVAVPQDGPCPEGIEIVVAGHPEPNRGSVAAARRGHALLAGAGPTDLALVLISGGGSALFELPVPGVALDDIASVARDLMRAGASIAELNTVRKHLSLVKGGGLAAACNAGHMVTLVVSDVIGSPLDVIASGPTVPDPSTFADALDVVRGRGISAPAPVLAYLERGAAGGLPETAKHLAVDQSVEVVADGGTAADAVRHAAADHGLAAEVVTRDLAGEAREVGAALVARTGAASGPGMWVHAGETTVTVIGPGRGGRNQELALAAGIAADGDPGVVVASLGTDGIDGPTPAAGAIGDGGTMARGLSAGVDAAGHLARNDAHPYLSATGDLLVTGPTGTNVGDLVVVWRTEGAG